MGIFNINDEDNAFKKINYGTKSFIRKLYKPSFIIVFFQFFIVTFFLIDNSNHIRNRLPLLLKYMSLSFDTFELKDYSEYFSNLISSRLSLTQLDRVDLNLSFRDSIKLDCDRQRNFNCTEDGWVKASMNSIGENYKIKLRAKGDRDLHRKSFNEMSFKIDIRGDKRFKGLEEFSMQIPVIRNYTIEALIARSLEKEKIISPRHFYVRLFINGQYMGVRHIEEGFSKELIEYSQRRHGPIFSLEEKLGTVYEKATFDLHDRRNWGDLNYGLPAQALSILNESKIDPEIFDIYFDQQKWASYMAMLDATKLFHGTVPKSVKFYLNPTTGLIEPIFFDGHYDLGLLDYHLSDVLYKDDQIPDCRWTCSNLYFYQMMFGKGRKVNKDFFILYFRALEKYTSKEYIEKVFEQGWKDLWLARGTIYREGHRRDANYSYGILPHVGQFNRIRKRLARIREDIKYAKKLIPLHSYDYKKSTIVLENKKSRFPQVYSLYCKNNKISTDKILVKDIPLTINMKSYSSCDKNNLYFSLNNGVDKKLLNKTMMSDLNLDKLIRQKKSLNRIEKFKKITFRRDFELNENLILNNKEIIFKSGVEFCIAKDKILHIKNSNIFFEGIENNSNLISNCDNGGASVVIENSNIFFKKLRISKLKAPNLNLRKLYGGINFINCVIEGNTLLIENSLSEDAVNFIDSKLKIDKLVFKNIKSDALDSDYSDLIIKKITCVNIGNDCLDLSFSVGIIDRFDSVGVKDKAVSLGEKSILNINKINVKNSSIGLVSKDSSKLIINNYYHENVSVTLSSYVKKNEFGSASIDINNIFPNQYNLDFISKDSIVKIKNQRINGITSSKEISNMLYGNLYGLKTKRL